MKLLWVVLLMVGTALGQSCPIKFERVRADDSVRQVYSGWYRYYFTLKWKNVSDKEIIGAVFQPFSYDAVRTKHDFYESWDNGQKAKPGESKHTQWEDTYEIQSGQANGKYAGIRLVKALFADGTTWEDDGSEQCEGKTPSVKW